MSRVMTGKTTTIRHEYKIPLPAYRKDIYEALSWADRDMEAAGKDHTYDDASTITADDEHIIVYWEEQATP